MVRRTTWIVLSVFVVLVGFAWFFQRYQTNKAGTSATATPTIMLANIYNLAGKQVNGVNISDSTGKKIEFTRNSETAQWAITNVSGDQADSFQIESNLAQLFAIKAEETLTQTPPLDSIGLVTPTYSINMTTANGEPITTHVGSITPTGSGYYIRVDSGSIVIVDKVVLDDVLNMLSNPPLIATPTPPITPTEIILPTDSGIQGTTTP
jgi:hypothetical protein